MTWINYSYQESTSATSLHNFNINWVNLQIELERNDPKQIQKFFQLSKCFGETRWKIGLKPFRSTGRMVCRPPESKHSVKKKKETFSKIKVVFMCDFRVGFLQETVRRAAQATQTSPLQATQEAHAHPHAKKSWSLMQHASCFTSYIQLSPKTKSSAPWPSVCFTTVIHTQAVAAGREKSVFTGSTAIHLNLIRVRGGNWLWVPF